MSKRTITLSSRRPVSIQDSDWPTIAKGDAHAGQYEFQAFDAAWVRVRRHADGRCLVYGYAGDGDGGGRPSRADRRAGYLVGHESEVPGAIADVVSELAETPCCDGLAEEAGRECLASMPAESI